MLRISKLTDYATVVMATMAAQPNSIHSAVTLANQTQIAQPTVGKILKALTQADLLTSYRGAQGGYRLSRAANEVKLTDIITALEGPLALTECSLSDSSCEHEAHCTQRPHWQSINQAVFNALSTLHLNDLMNTPTTQEPVA